MDTSIVNSPGWWFKRLALELSERQSNITTLSAYLDGDAPLPEGARGLRKAYQDFQRKSRTNFGELVVEATQERMMVAGFRTDGFDKLADRIWSVNEMGVQSTDVHGDMLGKAYGYVMVGSPDESGMPVITKEDPTQVITAHDPLRPSKVIAALKMYTDPVKEKDFAYVYLPGRVFVASRPAQAGAIAPGVDGYDWDANGDMGQFLRNSRLPVPVVPVVRFLNRKGKGEFETHTDILDRINYMLLQRLVITSIQAFRQRAVRGGELPETETVVVDGEEVEQPIDYNEIFRPGPGALWILPEGAELWESQSTDIAPLLAAVKDDARDLAAVTRTPMSMLIPDGANQSAEGAAAAREGLVFKVRDRIARATYGWNTVMQLALAFAGNGITNVETDWMDPVRPSLAERADASSKAIDLPLETKLREIWGFTPDKTERILNERLSDILSMNLGSDDV